MTFFSVKNLYFFFFFLRITYAPPPIAQKHSTLSPIRCLFFHTPRPQTIDDKKRPRTNNKKQQTTTNNNQQQKTTTNNNQQQKNQQTQNNLKKKTKPSVGWDLATFFFCKVTGGKNRHSKNYQHMDPQNLKETLDRVDCRVLDVLQVGRWLMLVR